MNFEANRVLAPTKASVTELFTVADFRCVVYIECKRGSNAELSASKTPLSHRLFN